MNRLGKPFWKTCDPRSRTKGSKNQSEIAYCEQ